MKRRIWMLVLCVAMLMCSTLSVMAAEITPRYNNVSYVNATADITSEGILTVLYKYTGNSDTTSVTINTLVERKTLLFFWSDVDEWTETVYDVNYSDSASLQLEKTGTYRVTVEYTFYGTGGDADTVTHEFELEY